MLSKHNTQTLVKATKAFALVSFAKALLKDSKTNTLKTLVLHKQCTEAMQGFHIAVGTEYYTKHLAALSETYSSLNDTGIKLLPSEALVFIEILLNLLSKKDMKDFLLMTYISGLVLSDDRMNILVDIALGIDKQLNELLMTKNVSSKDYLLGIFKSTKKVKIKKLKPKSKSQLRHEYEVEKARLSKMKKQQFLKSIRARAEELRKKGGI